MTTTQTKDLAERYCRVVIPVSTCPSRSVARDDKQRRGVATRRSTTPTSAKSALAGDHGSAAGRECFNGDTKKDSAREVREYFIPDFSNWKDHDSYQAGLVRLISDLKAGS